MNGIGYIVTVWQKELQILTYLWKKKLVSSGDNRISHKQS